MMCYIMNPSLEQRTLVKITTVLWNQSDLRPLLTKFYFRSFYYDEAWRIVQEKVRENVSKLALPKSLKAKVLNLVKPIGLQVLEWKMYHDSFLYVGKSFKGNLAKLCWTAQGTVDRKKTAELLVVDESLDITSRYKLACIYCLENYIPLLWDQIPQDCQKNFYSDTDAEEIEQQELVVFWTYKMKGKLSMLESIIQERLGRYTPYQYAVEYAALCGNKVAVEYFLQKLTPEEKVNLLVRCAGYVVDGRRHSACSCTCAPDEYYAHTLCFILSQMTLAQQMEVFECYPFQVLKCFLNWPWEDFFLPMVNRMWSFLSEKDFDALLRRLVGKVINGQNGCDYSKIFEELWKQGPDSYKRYVLNGSRPSGFLLSDLFRIQDERNVALILRDATDEERETIIFSIEGMVICECLLDLNKRSSLKFFLQACIPSRDMLIKFKSSFEHHINSHHSARKLGKDDIKNFWELLDGLAEEWDKKRCVDGEADNPSKKLCAGTAVNK